MKSWMCAPFAGVWRGLAGGEPDGSPSGARKGLIQIWKKTQERENDMPQVRTWVTPTPVDFQEQRHRYSPAIPVTRHNRLGTSALKTEHREQPRFLDWDRECHFGARTSGKKCTIRCQRLTTDRKY